MGRGCIAVRRAGQVRVYGAGMGGSLGVGGGREVRCMSFRWKRLAKRQLYYSGAISMEGRYASYSSTLRQLWSP